MPPDATSPSRPDLTALREEAERRESPALVIGSLVLLALDVVAYGGLAIHSLLSRRRYGQFVDRMDLRELTPLQDFFLSTPAPLYAAGFFLLVVALLVKEVALDRKSVALRINVLALFAALGLLAAFFWTVQWHFEALIRS